MTINGGHHFPYESAGLVGFGSEEDSFLSQLRYHHSGKFSHCLAPATSSMIEGLGHASSNQKH